MTLALKRGECSELHTGHTLPMRKTWYPFYSKKGGHQGTSGWAPKVSPPTRSRSLDRPAHSQSLYWLSYTAHTVSHLLQTTHQLRTPQSSQYAVYVRKHVTGTTKISKSIFPYNHNKHIHFIWTAKSEVMWSETYLKNIPMHSRQMANHLLKWNPKQKCLQRDQWLQFICTLWNSLGPQTVLQGTYMCTVETCI